MYIFYFVHRTLPPGVECIHTHVCALTHAELKPQSTLRASDEAVSANIKIWLAKIKLNPSLTSRQGASCRNTGAWFNHLTHKSRDTAVCLPTASSGCEKRPPSGGHLDTAPKFHFLSCWLPRYVGDIISFLYNPSAPSFPSVHSQPASLVILQIVPQEEATYYAHISRQSAGKEPPDSTWQQRGFAEICWLLKKSRLCGAENKTSNISVYGTRL